MDMIRKMLPAAGLGPLPAAVLFCIFHVAGTCPARAAEETVSTAVEGGRGLAYMQSARTYGKGALVFGLKTLVMEKRFVNAAGSGAPLEKKDVPAVSILPVTFGLTDEIDVTAALVGFHDGRGWLNAYDFTRGYGPPETGMGASRFGVKIRLPFSPDSRFQVAGKFGAVLDTSVRQLDGMNYRWTRKGTDIEASLYESVDLASFLSLHLEQGYVLSGSALYDDQIVGAAGIELRVLPWWRIRCEMDNRTFLGKGPQSVVNAGNDPGRYYARDGVPAIGNPAFLKDDENDYTEDFLVLAPSMVFRLNKFMSFDIGALINLADQAEPKESFQLVAGLTFATRIEAMVDSDGDGIKNNVDIEPDTPRGYPVDPYGRALDTDKDGVPDGADREPDTPLGARINDYGVGIDTDGDGVYDGLDMEPMTPVGCPVDKFGVALDDDRDGVPNGLDLEPDTAKGAVVNEYGIALDGDGDGVPDGLDMEPDTVDGAVVDRNGVALDGDGDGVPDGVDQEPNTPKGLLVDRNGRALIKQEFSLLREGLIRLNTIYFDGGSSEVPPEASHIIDEIGRIMMKYPSLRIQIEGHTDSVGDPAVNMRLARERARNVLEEILRRFPDLSRERFRVVGFGSEKPIASNKTFEGRKANRRVEFVVINQDGKVR